MFCGENCLQESWNLYHCWECKQGTSIFKCIGIAHLALRLTFETLRPDSNNDKIHSLITHINDLKLEELFQYTLVIFTDYINKMYIAYICSMIIIIVNIFNIFNIFNFTVKLYFDILFL